MRQEEGNKGEKEDDRGREGMIEGERSRGKEGKRWKGGEGDGREKGEWGASH